MFKQLSRKCLVSSSYSSAAEFPTAITDRLREQQGATQIPASSRAVYGYSSEQWYCNTVLIIRALDFSTNGTLLGYFAISWENVFSRDTLRAQVVERS